MTKKTLSIVCMVLALGFLVSFGLTGSASPTINYQGRLAQSGGSAYSGQVKMCFALYDAVTGGNLQWSECYDNGVSVTNGFFNVQLGSVSSLTGVDFSKELFLGITVGTDTEMSPRIRLNDVPHALGSKDDLKVAGNGYFGGNVGIGTTSPGQKLEVSGTTLLNGRTGINLAPDANAILRFGWASSGASRPATLYSAMLETNSDQDGLGIFQNDEKTSRIVFGSPANSASGYLSFFNSATAGSRKLVLSASGADQVTLQNNGNVGIGTTSPLAGLDVVGGISAHNGDIHDVNAIGGWDAGVNGTLDIYGLWPTTGDLPIGRGNAIRFFTDDNAGNQMTRLWIARGSGNVGIGTTSPQYKLDVEGDVQAYSFNTGDIVFQKDGTKLWRMFEEEDGLYLKNLKTGKASRVFLEEDITSLMKRMEALEKEIAELRRK